MIHSQYKLIFTSAEIDEDHYDDSICFKCVCVTAAYLLKWSLSFSPSVCLQMQINLYVYVRENIIWRYYQYQYVNIVRRGFAHRAMESSLFSILCGLACFVVLVLDSRQ